MTLRGGHTREGGEQVQYARWIVSGSWAGVGPGAGSGKADRRRGDPQRAGTRWTASKAALSRSPLGLIRTFTFNSEVQGD